METTKEEREWALNTGPDRDSISIRPKQLHRFARDAASVESLEDLLDHARDALQQHRSTCGACDALIKAIEEKLEE